MPRMPIYGEFQRATLLSAESPADDLDAPFDIEILTSFDTAAPVWREMIQSGSILSAYQDIAWMSTWWDHVGIRLKAQPHIVVLKDRRGQPIMLLPLLRQRRGIVEVAVFMGGKHANFNLPVWRPDLLIDLSYSWVAMVM